MACGVMSALGQTLPFAPIRPLSAQRGGHWADQGGMAALEKSGHPCHPLQQLLKKSGHRSVRIHGCKPTGYNLRQLWI